MNPFLNGVARAVAETFALPGPILEVGSYQVAGQEAIADLRALFAGTPYLGIDVRPGPGVDRLADVERLPYADGSFGTVIAMNTFEHVPRFWRGFEEIRRVLRPDGALLVSCPFYFHIHSYPSDYWRFTPQALELLLRDYPSKILGWHRVTIGAVEVASRRSPPDPFPVSRSLLPDRYRDPELSGLAREVQPGRDNAFDFDLE